jgi:hypothetical protein
MHNSALRCQHPPCNDVKFEPFFIWILIQNAIKRHSKLQLREVIAKIRQKYWKNIFQKAKVVKFLLPSRNEISGLPITKKKMSKYNQ